MAILQISTPGTGQTESGNLINQKRANVYVAFESKFFWILTLALALAGMLLRIDRAVLGRSFRGDEAALASAIQHYSLLDLLTKPLGGSITAPLGFLGIEKLVVELLGFQDFYYRLVPLLAGCLSVILMYFLAKELLGSFGAAFAVGAFALNWTISFYSSDLKQYSSDVVFAALIYLMAARYIKTNSTKNLFWLAAVGLIGIFCSHPAIFLLSSVGLVLAFQAWIERKKSRLIFLMGALWVGVFLILYFLSYRYVGQDSYNVDYWSNLGALMPVPPWKNPGWFVTRFSAFFATDLSLSQFTFIEAAMYGVGIIYFYLKHKWQWSIIFLGSIIFTLLASGIANYPFKGRLILFLAPGSLLTIGAGIDALALKVKSSSFLSHSLQWLLAAFLLWGPLTSAYNYLVQPRAFPYREDIKPVLLYVEQHKQPADQVVVYDEAAVTYAYYAPFYDLDGLPAIYLGDYRKKPIKYHQVIDGLPKNQRVWFVFSNVLVSKGNISDRTYMFDYLNSLGGRFIEQYGGSDTFSSAYLVITK